MFRFQSLLKCLQVVFTSLNLNPDFFVDFKEKDETLKFYRQVSADTSAIIGVTWKKIFFFSFYTHEGRRIYAEACLWNL